MAIRIAPSILSADFGRLAEEVQAVERAGADLIHVDVMDGRFVPNLTIGPVVVEAVRRATRLPLDVHLMIEEPERYVEDFARAGADNLTVHAEACRHLHRVLEHIRSLGKQSSVVVNPHTPIEMIRHVLPDVSMVLIMSVNPGFGGQKYIPEATRKIRELSGLLEREGLARVAIEVDGGVKADNVAEPAGAGATVIVAGSAIFSRGATVEQYAERIRKLRENAERAHAAG
jgi:ribulose-phosphate 3-epimerase